ncbi:SpoIIE family protein phosphatase [Streptomyces sp. NPDC014846]|uniref:SpoIIE family protein phosphatase n=1 Tax=Streptomyces sp. NPDC014846 TaxID=3364922 RepID=UPI0036F641AB
MPPDLPLLPGLQLAARYVLTEKDSAAGGDWYDALVLPDGRVGFVVGDVVGHGVRASAVMGQLRAVVQERLRAGCTPARALRAVDAHAAHVPGARGATCNITVLDPADGSFVHAGAGHPAALVIDDDGTAHFLPDTGDGPLTTDAFYSDHAGLLGENGTLLHYSDGTIERPGVSPNEGRRELARVAADAALNRLMPTNSLTSVADRITDQALELLLRESGHSDDLTLLAAHRTAPPVPLDLTFAAHEGAVRTAYVELGAWLARLGCTADDESTLQHAIGELVTNAVEHAYTHPQTAARRREVRLRAQLAADGTADILVSDLGRWVEQLDADPFRGRGLAMAALFTDDLHLERAPEGHRERTAPYEQITLPAA